MSMKFLTMPLILSDPGGLMADSDNLRRLCETECQEFTRS
jgi:hypothetical protein